MPQRRVVGSIDGAWDNIAQFWPSGSESAKSSTQALLPLAAWSALLAWLLPVVFNEPLHRNPFLKEQVRTRFGKVDDLDRAIRACIDKGISFPGDVGKRQGVC